MVSANDHLDGRRRRVDRRLRLRVLSGVFALVYGLCVPASAQDVAGLYGRMVAIFDRNDQRGLARLLDSVDRAGGNAPDTELLRSVMRSHLAQRKGDIPQAHRILEGVGEDLSDAHHLARILVHKEKARALKSLRLYDEAMAELAEARELAQAHGVGTEAVNCLVMIAENKRAKHDYEGALRDLIDAERAATALGHVKGLCNTAINRGNVLYFQDRFPEALERYREALECAMASGFQGIAGNALGNIGSVTFYLEGPRAALDVYRQALESGVARIDSGFQASARANMAIMHNELGEHRAARRELAAAMRILEALGDTVAQFAPQRCLATTYWALGHRDSAMWMTRRVIGMSQVYGAAEVRAEAEGELAERLAEMGRWEEAMAHLRVHHHLRDSLAEIKRGRAVYSLEIQFETEKKEQALQLRGLELAQERAIKRRRELQINVLVAVLVSLTAIGMLVYRSIRQKRAIAEQGRTISEQRVEQVLRERELRMIEAMLEGQEKERVRVAGELHDRLGSTLSAIKLQFEALRARDGVDDRGKLSAMLDDAVGEVRRVSHTMAHGSLAQFGLVKALEDLRDALAVPGLEVELGLFGLEDRLPQDVEIAVYRIVQELVGNALKHAEAAHLSIQVTRAGDRLNVIVEDDGKGFDMDKVPMGMGLPSMRQRAAQLGGGVHIDTLLGRGTIVSVDLPLAKVG